MRWSNIPVPEPHVAAIVGAAALHFVLPLRIPLARGIRFTLAGPMLATGIGLASWAVASAGDADVESESALVTDGAYAVTRNPMYVGWSVGVLGLALATGSAWLLAGGTRPSMHSIARSMSRRRGCCSASAPRSRPTGTASRATSGCHPRGGRR